MLAIMMLGMPLFGCILLVMDTCLWGTHTHTHTGLELYTLKSNFVLQYQVGEL